MRMSKSILTAAAAAASLILASCYPPPEVPPPRFTPNPPYPPEPVDPEGQAYDPYGQPANPSPPPEPARRPGEYPTARGTAKPNEVISPYEPYNVIDVEGFRSGQLARDPSNNKIFQVP
jgi:hypothetical protein